MLRKALWKRGYRYRKNYKELQNIQSFKELGDIYLVLKNKLNKTQREKLFNFYYPDFIKNNINQQSILTMINYVNMLLKPECEVNGVVINPFDHNLVITKDMVQAMLKKGNYSEEE